MMHHPVHATAEEIFQAINQSDPRASRATVYNSLHALVEVGLVRELVLEGEKSSRFDANVESHHHFICERCGKLEDVEWFDLPRLARQSALGARSVRSYQVLFRGDCAECSAKSERSL